MRPNWPQSWSVCFGEETLFSVPVIERRLIGFPALSPTFLKCCAGKGCRRLFGTDSVRIKEKGNILRKLVRGNLYGVLISFVGTAFSNTLLKEMYGK
jgi:hypothetical protein